MSSIPFRCKALTRVIHADSVAELAALESLMAKLNCDLGKGWSDQFSDGKAFLMPLGNLEIVLGTAPAECDTLVEVSGLDELDRRLRALVASEEITLSSVEIVDEIKVTHWNSRILLVKLTKSVTLGFWEWVSPAMN